jgi:hypothetical protein
MNPYNQRRGQKLQTDASGVAVDRAFPAHIHIPATQAIAADDDGILAINLAESAQTYPESAGITSPEYPRALSVKGNVAGIIGNVKITGKNFDGEAIDETIALNGTTTVHGAKAFKEITQLEFPVQVHEPVLQVETATAVGTVTTAGNAAVTVTSKLFAEAVAVAVPVEVDDDAAAIALAIRTALAADPDVSANFDVSGDAAAVVLSARVPAANDSTLNIAIADGTGEGASVGVTTAANSANTTAGVPYDIVSVGWNDKLGLPFKLAHNTVLATYLDNVLEATDPTVTTDVDEIEKNTIDLNSALDGHVVDIYLMV